MNRKLTREEAIALHREMWADMQANLGDNPNCVERVAFKKKLRQLGICRPQNQNTHA